MLKAVDSKTEVPQALNNIPHGDCVVVGVGARTCIGLDALQTTLGIRAELLRPADTRFVDKDGDLVGMCCVRCLSTAETGAKRLIALAAPAMQEAARSWRRVEEARRGVANSLPLVVAVPEGVVEYSRARQKSLFLEALEAAVPGLIDVARSHEIIGGRAAGVQALGRAVDMLQAGAEAVLVGGVDSYYDPDRLDALSEALRLHGMGTENGFIPGEAAAFIVLTHRHHAASLTRYASILGHGMENEPRPFGSDDPCQALGMTAALRKATTAVGARRMIGWQLTDVVNERHRVDEWQYATGRTFQLFTDDVLHEQPLVTIGDVGTAAATLFIVEAAVRWQTACGLSDLAVLALHSDGPERGAVLIASEQ